MCSATYIWLGRGESQILLSAQGGRNARREGRADYSTYTCAYASIIGRDKNYYYLRGILVFEIAAGASGI